MRIDKNAKKALLTAAAAALVIIICVVVYVKEKEKKMMPQDYPFCVCFFNVGQGDCELIRCDGVNVLIDGGEAEYGYQTEQYLKACGVEKLDCYILTHPHSDHIGCSAHIIRTFPVDTVMTTAFNEFNMPTTKVYEDMLAMVEETGAQLLTVSGGESYSFGDLSLKILSPLEETDDYNDMSITVRAKYKSDTFLFMGDASKDVETQLLNTKTALSADVLKVGHHGSDSSTGEAFLKAVSPDHAVISCGADNAFGHPHSSTLQLLEKYGVEVYRTDLNGSVIFYGYGHKLSVWCAS